MTKMLAPELAKFKIRINVVCPGAIETSTGLSHILCVFISFLSLPTKILMIRFLYHRYRRRYRKTKSGRHSNSYRVAWGDDSANRKNTGKSRRRCSNVFIFCSRWYYSPCLPFLPSSPESGRSPNMFILHSFSFLFRRPRNFPLFRFPFPVLPPFLSSSSSPPFLLLPGCRYEQAHYWHRALHWWRWISGWQVMER